MVPASGVETLFLLKWSTQDVSIQIILGTLSFGFLFFCDSQDHLSSLIVEINTMHREWAPRPKIRHKFLAALRPGFVLSQRHEVKIDFQIQPDGRPARLGLAFRGRQPMMMKWFVTKNMD